MNATAQSSLPGVGVQMIDRDHSGISEILLEIGYYVTHDSKHGLQRRLLAGLNRTMLSHFALEESMMLAARYPGLAQHGQRHRAIIERMQRLMDGRCCAGTGLALQQAVRLWDEHENHVVYDDMNFSRWLNGFRVLRQERRAGRNRAIA